MMQDESKVEKIDLIHLMEGALRHVRYTWWMAILLVVGFAILGNLYSRATYSPRYKVYASFVVNASSIEDSTSYAYTNKETTKQLNQTFPYILTSGALSKIVAEDLGYETLPVNVTAEALGEINLFRITVTGSDPQLCMRALNSIIENYPTVAKYILGTTQLSLFNMSRVPEEPYNAPNHTGAMKKFAVLGLLVYLLFVAFKSLTSRTVHSKEMLSRYISVPILGTIPQIGSQKKKKSPIQIANGAVSGQYREAMESLRLRLAAKLEHRGWKSIYVTSSMAGEGKTTMACNLAVLMAQHGHSVVLIDADLRNPSVSRTLGLIKDKDAPGMNDFLKGKNSLNEILVKSEIPNLRVLPGGRSIDRVRDQFTNGRYENVINALKDQVDLIIVDTPPCAMLDDAVMAAEHLDGGLLVVRKDYASIDAVIAGSELLAKTHSPLFACAMNLADSREYLT